MEWRVYEALTGKDAEENSRNVCPKKQGVKLITSLEWKGTDDPVNLINVFAQDNWRGDMEAR